MFRSFRGLKFSLFETYINTPPFVDSVGVPTANHENNYCAVLGLVTFITLLNFKSIGLVDQKLCYLASIICTYDKFEFACFLTIL